MPISKFSNLGPGGLARRVAPVEPIVSPEAPKRVTRPSDPPKAPTSRSERWRAAHPELYLARQREYQRTYRKRKSGNAE